MLETQSPQGFYREKTQSSDSRPSSRRSWQEGQENKMWGRSSWGLLRLSILHISNKLGGTENWGSSSKQCQDSQPRPLGPPDLHKVSHVPSPRNQKPSSYFPVCPPAWMAEGKSSEKMTIQGCHSRL